MGAVTVTVLRPGWWLPGRALAEGETLTLDVATAEGLARRGIVRLPDAVTGASQPDEVVASNANKPARKRAKKED
ncbi:hypothetical protein EDC36_12048 [Tepidimonas ignava]|uniref:Uncharacterized protein n=1 Tax=Tepidimonas ignava TaxID=114249 RepID=A0A4R3L9F9_9BURK|nr:hypothetical protein [Tepidimonas ignava]TCS94126.1 hypothetical protein EDC36_12048 [Tepidimonas ignava]TSE18952.1 hypothetical protein Tigna_02399 [Tepidimonas ignava]